MADEVIEAMDPAESANVDEEAGTTAVPHVDPVPVEQGTVQLQLSATEQIREIFEQTLSQAEATLSCGVWRIGRLLLDVKKQIPHGEFERWIQEKVLPIGHWSHTTIKKFMRAGKKPNFELFRGDRSAMYLLTATRVPSQAVEEALQQSAAGGFVTHSQARELIQNHSGNGGHKSEVGELGSNAVIEDGLADAGDAESKNTTISDAASQLDKLDQARLSSRSPAASAAMLEALPVADPELAICVIRDWEMNPADTEDDAGGLLSMLTEADLPEQAICFLRVPPARLNTGLQVLNAWGFVYYSCLAHKRPHERERERHDLWFRPSLDLVLIGVRGGVPAVAGDDLLPDDPVYAFVPPTLEKKIRSWLPGIPVRTIIN